MLQLRKPYALLLVILTVLAVYYSAIFAEILSIDDHEMIEGLINREGFSFKRHFFPGGGYYYRPVLSLTYIADKYLWGAHESFMHLENVLLHALNAVLVYLITAKIIASRQTQSGLAPLFAALLFALHPLATEPVNWISGRTDLLAGLFVLISCYFLLVALKSSANFPLVIAAIALFLSALSKENGLFWYPAALFLVYGLTRTRELSFPNDLWHSIRQNYRFYLILTAAPVAYLALRHFALMTRDSSVSRAVSGIVTGQHHDLYNKLRISLKVFGFYLKKTLFPLPLNFTINTVSNWYVLVGVIGLLACVYLLYKRNVIAALLLTAACITAPALLVPLGRIALAPVAERYLYIPIAFVSIAIILVASNHFQQTRISVPVVLILSITLLSIFGYVTVQRNLVWQKNLTLFQDSVAKNPDNTVMRNELANALRKEGRHAEADLVYQENRPASDEKIALATDINRALTLYRNNDIKGAAALLKGIQNPQKSSYYNYYLQQRILFNDRLLSATVNPLEKAKLQEESLSLMIERQRRTGDPLGYYTIGQMAMNLGKMLLAYDNFKLAAEKAPPKAYYKEPAIKLAERLQAQLGEK